MVINQEFVDKILSRSRELFNFRGLLKYYPGRDFTEEKSKLFQSYDLFMDYFFKSIPWEAEYYLISRRRSEVSFRLKEEIMLYQMDNSGEFTLMDYEDRSVDERKIHHKIDRNQLIKEMKYIISKTSRRPKSQKKSA